MKRFEIFFGLLKIPADFVMTALAFIAAYKLRLITTPLEGFAKPIDLTVLPTLQEYILFSLNAAAALVAIFTIGKMYTLRGNYKLSKEISKTITLGIVWFMALITYFFYVHSFPFSRLALLYSWALSILFIIIGRIIIKVFQRILFNYGLGKRSIIFIGNNEITQKISEKISQDHGYKILGIIGNKNSKTSIPLLGSIQQLKYILRSKKPDEIIQTETETSQSHDQEILEFCELNHISYRFIPNLIDVRRTNISVDTISGIPIINLKPTPLDGWGKVIKRIMDIIGAIVGFIVLSPIFIITAVAIKIDSKGPILFSKLDNGQPVKRVGQNGRLFKFYKFRSMQPKTDSLRYKHLSEQNLRKDGPLVKISNDPRVTNIGKFLRKYSIDELPQLWNVLVGNMSLVGPRPHLPEEVANYKDHHHFVLTIKPGLTGMAQISGRSDLNFEEEVKLDRFYIENWSLLLDLKIIFKTLTIVMRGYKE